MDACGHRRVRGYLEGMGTPLSAPRVAWLVNLFGDPEAQHAHAAALLRPLALRLNATVVPVYCLEEDAPALRDVPAADRVPTARAALEALLARHALPAAPPVVVAAGDQPPHRVMADALAAAIQNQEAVLALVHTHRYNAVERFFLGSFSERFTERTPCPLMVLTPHASIPQTFDRVLFATDCSNQSRAALHRALPVLRALQGTLHVEHLLPVHELPLFVHGEASKQQYRNELQVTTERADAQLRALVHAADAAGVRATPHIETINASTVPGEGIMARRKMLDASLIVVAAHGDLKRPGGIGSTARWLMRHADVPVLVIPATADSAHSS